MNGNPIHTSLCKGRLKGKVFLPIENVNALLAKVVISRLWEHYDLS